MLKLVGAIAAGVIAAFVTIVAVELLGRQAYPTGEVDLRDSEAVAEMIASMPTGALLVVAFSWFLGALTGGSVAAVLSGRWRAAWAVGALVALAAVANILMYPHPEWMQVLAVIAPGIGAVIAGHFVRTYRPAQAEAGEP